MLDMVLIPLVQYRRNYLVFEKEFVVRTSSRIKNTKKSAGGMKMSQEDLNAGFYIVVPLLAGTFLGYQIDKWFATKPLFLLLGIGLGVVSAFYNLMKLAKK